MLKGFPILSCALRRFGDDFPNGTYRNSRRFAETANLVLRNGVKVAAIPEVQSHGVVWKVRQILRHANVTTTINIYVKMVTQDAEEAMKRSVDVASENIDALEALATVPLPTRRERRRRQTMLARVLLVAMPTHLSQPGRRVQAGAESVAAPRVRGQPSEL